MTAHAWLTVPASLLLLALASTEDRLAGQGQAPKVVNRSTALAPRVAPRAQAQWTPEERALAAEYSTDAGAGNGFNTFLNHPAFVKGVMPFFNYMTEQPSLSARHREILILRTAWLSRSEYLWAHHASAAVKAGLSRDELRRIAEGPDSSGWDPFEATLLRMADQLHHTAFVNDATWGSLSARFTAPDLIDAVFLVCEFTMISGMHNSLGVQIEQGVTDRFPGDVAYRVSVPNPEPPLAKPRIAPLEPAEWSPAARAMLEPNARNNYVIRLYRTYARNERLFPPRQNQSEYIRLKSTLSAHVRELLILRTGWLARAEYEWAQHAPTGRRAGLDTVLIAKGADAPGWDPVDATLVRAADELYRDDVISDATWTALAAKFDTKALMDMLVTAGGYRQVSMSANAFGVQLEPNAERFPDVGSR